MKDFQSAYSANLPETDAPDFVPRLRRALSNIEEWARDASLGFARISAGQSPNGSGSALVAVTSHHGLTDLTTYDDHSQYLLLAGRDAGQVAYGGPAGETGSLTLLGGPLSASSYGYVHFTATPGAGITIRPQNGRMTINKTPSSGAASLDIIGENGAAPLVNLKQFNGSSGSALTCAAPGGSTTMFEVNGNNDYAPSNLGLVTISNVTGTATRVPLVARGGTAQSGSLQEWQNSSSTSLLKVTSTGSVANGAGPSGSVVVVGNTTAASGVLGYVSLTGQTAAIGSTNLAVSPTAGFYAVEVYVMCTTLSGSGSPTLDVTVAWTDAVGATTATAITGFSLSATGRQGGRLPMLVASGNISYTTTINAAAGSPQYAISIRVVGLG